MKSFTTTTLPRHLWKQVKPTTPNQRQLALFSTQPHTTTSYRSHTCGQATQVGEQVQLVGWLENVRKFGPMAFGTLRDRYGLIQLVFKEANLHHVPLESILSISGTVAKRPTAQANPEMKSGRVEVHVSHVKVLNVATKVPIPVHIPDVSEAKQLKYRFVDLRRPALQRNLLLRSQIALGARNYLATDFDFVEIETPTLFKSTPEGAREFLVPTRTLNQFYALTQSPQQYKQLLMIGGLDRYFQIARCYRDENGRADRQPEFTQIDLEMSFVSSREIMAIVEGLVKHVATTWLPKSPFPVLTYDHVMSVYGSDKPDRRYGMFLNDIVGISSSNSPIFQKTTSIRGFNVHQLETTEEARTMTTDLSWSRKELGELQKHCQDNAIAGTRTFVIQLDDAGHWKSSMKSHVTLEEQMSISRQLQGKPGDVLIVTCGGNKTSDVSLSLGRARQHCAERVKAKLPHFCASDRFEFLWVVDFPLFEETSEGVCATHHPFTAPAEGFGDALGFGDDGWDIHDPHSKERLLQVKAQHFDLVCNGWELGGGSMRIHSADLQQHVFQRILELPKSQQESFGHLIQGLESGAPPHGGMALGLDRLVAIFAQASSLRDVIAFPKSTTGKELMTNAPGPVTPEQLKEYQIELRSEEGA